ncbi:MAG: alanine racemase [Ruminococcus sp.]|nr:alanine racemase [Ruminococcus sp.]
MDFLRRCWAEISLENIKYNYEQYRKLIHEGTEIMCVVKASCYGHGDDIIAPYLQNELGVTHFAVSNILEGIRLRDMDITGEILVLGYTPPENAEDLVKYDIIQACTELSYAQKLSETKSGRVRIHCAVDTGMTRIGLCGSAEEIAAELSEISKLENISLEGAFTHFAAADGLDKESHLYTKRQSDKFFNVCSLAEQAGVSLKHKHSLNSAGGLFYYDSRNTLARLGIILYGLYPDPALTLPFEPKPVMTLKAVISQIKYIGEGTTVSYGRTYTADKKIKLATVTAGYADGYPRALSNIGEVIVGGKLCKITGRICMDQFMCDVTEVENVRVGDEIILMGDDNGLRITADDIAGKIGTIGYEAVCNISSRVPRIEK